MPLSINIDPIVEALGLAGSSLLSAMLLASQILDTDRYCCILIENISDERKPSIREVREEIQSMAVILSIIEIGEHMDAYALVYRDDYPGQIFLNPLLLMQSRIMELKHPTTIYGRKLSLFLAAKIIHEISHLVHPNISPKLRNQVKKRSIGGEGKKKMTTPEKSKGGAKFKNFGEMVEYDIFGGILEINTSDVQPVAYLVDELILYEHPTSSEGRLVVVKESADYVVSPGLEDFILAVSDTVDKPYEGPRGHLGVSVRFSSPGAAAEADVITSDTKRTLNPTY